MDHYIQIVTLKYRLAVALAVLKGKPQDVSLENYIELMKSKINNENIDDLDLTVCSDDFEIEENAETNTNTSTNNTRNSVTILNDCDVHLHDTEEDIIENTEEMTENRKTQSNFIAETQDTTNFTQVEKAPDLDTTFCLTQTPLNPNSIQNGTNVLLNGVSEPNGVNLKTHEVNRIDDLDSQATELYSFHGYTQNCTHVSQSQNNKEIVISDKLLKAKSNAHQSTINDKIQEINRITQSTQNISNSIELEGTSYEILEICGISDDQPNISTVESSKNATRNLVDTFYNKCKEINLDYDKEINEHTILKNTNEQDIETIINTNDKQHSIQIIESFPHNAQDYNDIPMFQDTVAEIHDIEINKNINEENEEITEIDTEISNESQIVSFKVVEELNKVRNYINKRLERRISTDGSIDSGYKSESQSKSSFRSSLQLSGNWLNQSAHSLFEYITECPLLATTNEIIVEIAQVLGQLIDRLHEEEKYPSFLDEILENVNILLQDLFEESAGDDVLLTKDEKIQRLLLLNKSVHIQKYSIEKITTLLENLLTHLTNAEENYEITNISQIENTCYIFHLLEILLKRYLKCKNVVSQELSDSQLEIKKSSITELWRKKWNSNYKDESIEEFTPRKCVLIQCNEILNKLIVASMDGYSLIAFSALNCFNLLQS